MIGTIRKHSQILWWIIVVIIVITFVVWGSKTSMNGDHNQRELNFGSINGEKIAQEDYSDAYREVALGYFFSYNEFPTEASKRMGFDIDRETYFRLLFLQKIKQEKIQISDETVAKTAADLLRAMNRGQPLPLSVFVEKVLAPKGLTAADFERYIRHMLAMQQLMTAHAARGKLVTPAEARVLYERENEEVATEAVFFSATNFMSSVSATPDAVARFWTNQMANYRLPARVQVSYVTFGLSNLLAQSEAELVKTNFNELIDAGVQEVGTNYYRDAKTPEEIRGKVREDLIRRNAARLARKQANDFVNEVAEMQPTAVENFAKKAQEKNLTVKVTEPFDENGPKDFVVGADFIKEAFMRTPEEPFAGPFSGADGAYAIALKARLPSEIPSLDSIRDRVTADFKRFEATLAARRAGDAFAQAVTNGLAAGKKFSAIAEAAKVKPITIPPISLTTRASEVVEAHVPLNQFKNAAFTTAVGHASGFIPTQDGGFVVFVSEKLPIELAKLTADLPEFMNRLRATRQSEAQNEWFRREAERGLRDTPVFRQQQQGGVVTP